MAVMDRLNGKRTLADRVTSDKVRRSWKLCCARLHCRVARYILRCEVSMGCRMIQQNLASVPSEFGCRLQRRHELSECRGILITLRYLLLDEKRHVALRTIGVLSPEPPTPQRSNTKNRFRGVQR